MNMRIRNHPGIALLAMFFIFCVPASSHAQELFRFYPEAQINGFYGDNIQLKTNNGSGGFGSAMVAGFYLDYTSSARYASLHWDTFAQLFTHQTELDRAGEGQYVNATDTENISSTTKIRFDDFFYRDAPTVLTITTSDQAPQFNSLLAELLLANDQVSINRFSATMWHSWGRGWTSEFSVHQTTFFGNSDNSNNNSTNSYVQSFSTNTDYHFTERFSLGGGYRYYDFQFSAAGRPDEQAHWPFARVTWQANRNLFLSAIGGVVIAHTQGTNNDTVSPGALGLVEYTFHHGILRLYGGQEPELTSGLGGVGEIRGGRGNLVYYFTPRVTGTAGGGFYQSNGNGFNAQLISWGVGVSDRLNKSLAVYARFTQIQINEKGRTEFLPTGFQSGREATGNYFILGLSVSVEAFRWSWL
jgi:hypothetical protein